MPPATQMAMISQNCPPSAAMLPGLRKTPEPIVFPTTMAVARTGPKARLSLAGRAATDFAGGGESLMKALAPGLRTDNMPNARAFVYGRP